MITGLTIQNFRGFRDMTLDGLARVNLLVGDNGSGKTALLEAVFLAMSSSSLVAAQLRRVRGLPPEMTADTIGEFITEGAKDVTVTTKGPGLFARSLRVQPDPKRATVLSGRLGNSPSNEIAVPQTDLPQSNVMAPPLVFRWQDGEGASDEAVLQIGPTGMSVVSVGMKVVGTQILTSAKDSNREAASMFSALDRTGDAAPFIEEMKRQFPYIEVLSVQLENLRPLLCARVSSLKGQLPLELHSGGMAWLALILLSIAAPQIRIVLIDEIENGLHHARFRLLWQQVRDFAERFDTQVFATTHSQECLDAAADAMSEHPEDFAFIRTTRLDDGCTARLLPGADAGHLLRSGLEVRG
jgi:energy-coupling factor transporter ATP-binding protein EcfA2